MNRRKFLRLGLGALAALISGNLPKFPSPGKIALADVEPQTLRLWSIEHTHDLMGPIGAFERGDIEAAAEVAKNVRDVLDAMSSILVG